MMMFSITLLTVILVLDCLVLMLLVLVQLPKKEAGMGQAFGGAATDALFGAGSGNALTKMTQYATGIFFVLTLTISILFSNYRHQKTGLEREAARLQSAPSSPAPAPASATEKPAAPANTFTATGAVANTATSAAAPNALMSLKAATNLPAATPPATTTGTNK
ncbi:MAG TPA: preprotein translocase subunit SecG [Verrucomicrobiae bacterium]|jgi:preprotein translocase subunit SecG